VDRKTKTFEQSCLSEIEATYRKSHAISGSANSRGIALPPDLWNAGRVKILKNSNLVNDDTESFTTGSSVTLHFVEVRLWSTDWTVDWGLTEYVMFVTVLPVAAASVFMRRAWSLKVWSINVMQSDVNLYYLFVIVLPVIVIPLTVTPELMDPWVILLLRVPSRKEKEITTEIPWPPEQWLFLKTMLVPRLMARQSSYI